MNFAQECCSGPGTKGAELIRSAELYKEIVNRNKVGYYFGLAFLLDSGYGKEEIKQILKLLESQARKEFDAIRQNP